MAAKTRFINPERLVRSPAYTQVVEVVSPGRTIYISGQLGTDRDGKLAAGEFRAQAEQVFTNLQAALAAPTVQERLTALGVEPTPMTVEEFGTFYRDDVAAILKLAKDANITPTN